MTFQPIDTPLVMSGFLPDAIRFWQHQTSGTSLEPVAAGGSLGGMSSASGSSSSSPSSSSPVPTAHPTLEPGSAVSMQLIRGDLEVAATCTVTYVDPKQLLACGHPVLGAGPVSLPMTTADVVATLASPLNSFKIINTGVTIGAFTEDRESAIRGVMGAQARMIPVHVAIDSPDGPRNVNVEVLDLPSLTPRPSRLFSTIRSSNPTKAAETLSYHVTGSVDIAGYPSVPLDLWAPSGSQGLRSMAAALLAGKPVHSPLLQRRAPGRVRPIDLHVEAIPRAIQVALEQARVASGNIVHAGDTVYRRSHAPPWQQPRTQRPHCLQAAFPLATGNLRLLVSDGGHPRPHLASIRLSPSAPDLDTVLAEARDQHRADRIYVSLLVPETQADIDGQTLTSLPLSVANALEPLRTAQDASLNGESAELAGEAPAGGVLSGFQDSQSPHRARRRFKLD